MIRLEDHSPYFQKVIFEMQQLDRLFHRMKGDFMTAIIHKKLSYREYAFWICWNWYGKKTGKEIKPKWFEQFSVNLDDNVHSIMN